MSTMVSQELDVAGWTTIANGPIAGIRLQGIPGGWSVAVGSSAPASGATGFPVTSLDGVWVPGVTLAAGDNVYGKPFGRQVGIAGQTITGVKN